MRIWTIRKTANLIDGLSTTLRDKEMSLILCKFILGMCA